MGHKNAKKEIGQNLTDQELLDYSVKRNLGTTADAVACRCVEKKRFLPFPTLGPSSRGGPARKKKMQTEQRFMLEGKGRFIQNANAV